MLFCSPPLLSLGRLFEADFEDGSLDILATGTLPLEAVVAGKAFAHWLTTALPLIALAPLLGLLLNLRPDAYGVLVATMLAGTPPSASSAPSARRLTVRARRGGLLIGLLLLPLFVPTLIFRDRGHRRGAIGGRQLRCLLSAFDRRFPRRYGAGAAGSRPGRSDFSCSDRAATNCAGGDKGLDANHAKPDPAAGQSPAILWRCPARLLPWCWGLAASLIGIGLYLAFFGSPPDYQQGQTVKIMYIHVPAAWLSMLVYALIALSSFGLLVFRHPLADVSAKAAAPLGATFTFLALATGSLWGKPMWGTFWVWDPRLTSGADLVLSLSRTDRVAFLRSRMRRWPPS